MNGVDAIKEFNWKLQSDQVVVKNSNNQWAEVTLRDGMILDVPPKGTTKTDWPEGEGRIITEVVVG